jgi:valyl-tRNA synthetase
VLDPDRKKMSKSKGNVVTPAALIDEYGADGIRYWACRAAPGTDTAADPAQMRVGRRLAIKVLNVTKFVLGLGAEADRSALVTEALDRSLLAQLAGVVREATGFFEAYEHSRALEVTEGFFWMFCDDYVELVKTRAYGTDEPSASARTALASALSTFHRLFGPFLPFVTEEGWSWWQTGSVHRASWPTEALSAVRKAKTAANLSLRAEAATVTVVDTEARIQALRTAERDIREAGRIQELILSVGEPTIVVQLQINRAPGLADAVQRPT